MQMTSDQSDAFQKFKSKVSDVTKPHHDELYLHKWLKARKYDVKRAGKMFRKSMKWRETVGADTLLDTWNPPDVMRKYYPGGIVGRDREGNVVYLDPFGQIDLQGIMRSVKKDDIIKTMVYRLEMIERLRRQQTTREKPIHQCIHIQDMSGFSSRIMFRAGLKLVLEILDMLEQNYPESLKTTYIINAPKVFVTGYALIKKFMNKDITAKFKMLGSDWQEEVFRVVDRSQLPKFYGGEMEDDNGDPKCSQVICYGGKVPEEFYSKLDVAVTGGNNTRCTKIGIKNSFSLPLLVPTANCVIRWFFSTEKGDIVFSVFQDVLGELKLLPLGSRKVNCDLTPEEGILQCSEMGEYVLHFENPSMTSARKLHYYGEVLDVEGEQVALQKLLDDTETSGANLVVHL